jgi:hypothetical protein
MNEKVRTYLIEAARQKDAFVYYSDMVKDCGLDIDFGTPEGQAQLKEILTDIARFEYASKRPMLTSIAIAKQDNNHGNGFYDLAEEFGHGKNKILHNDFWGIKEAEKTRLFWQDENNYKIYASVTPSKQKTIADLFVSLTESENFGWANEWKDNYIIFVKDIMILQSILQKNPLTMLDDYALYAGLSAPIRTYESFMAKWLKEQSNGISSRGQSVLSKDNFSTIIKDDAFKTIAKAVLLQPNISNYNLLTGWWYSNDLISNRPLLINRAFAACNPQVLSSTVGSAKFWNVITTLKKMYGFKFKSNHEWNWFAANIELTAWLDTELTGVLAKKSADRLEQLIWRNIFVWLIYEAFNANESIIPNSLTKKDKPQNGFDAIPDVERKFKGFDTDYVAKAKAQKDLGDAGEALVMEYEIQTLQQKGFHNEAAKVCFAKDGEGYDICSFDDGGNEKFIEVKTTTGNELAAFYLSENEVAFMRLHLDKYSIYRVYNYDEEYNAGDFFEIKENVEEQLLMKPTQYQVLIKKESK